MTDHELEALKEALGPAEQFGTFTESQGLIRRAARGFLRLMETAENIGYCLTHKASWVPSDEDEEANDIEDACLYWHWVTDMRFVERGYSSPLHPCRMVEKLLIDAPKEAP